MNKTGVSELMKSSEMQAVLNGYGNRILQIAGSGHKMESKTTKKRGKVSIKAVSRKAIKDNLENNTLVKALYSAKG